MHLEPRPLTSEEEAAWRCRERVCAAMRGGDSAALSEVEREFKSFPQGTDPALERRWLTNAIDDGALQAVAWMIERKVELSYVDDEGYTPLTSALQVPEAEKRHALLRLLLSAGSRHDLVGVNVWTAAHFAASEGDLEALRILTEFGADLCACTEDLGSWSTPADVARFHNHSAALQYLDSVCMGTVNRVYRSNVRAV